MTPFAKHKMPHFEYFGKTRKPEVMASGRRKRLTESIYVTDGGLQVITATGDSFRKAATYQVANSPTWAPPVLLKGGLLVKDHETLTRWSLPDASGE